jgi:hypothetical protein
VIAAARNSMTSTLRHLLAQVITFTVRLARQA